MVTSAGLGTASCYSVVADHSGIKCAWATLRAEGPTGGRIADLAKASTVAAVAAVARRWCVKREPAASGSCARYAGLPLDRSRRPDPREFEEQGRLLCFT
jgi:hypothetical protein